jgi:hypothetical protein
MPYFGILTAANPEEDLHFVKQEFQKLHEYFDPIADTVNTIINYNATEQAVFETFLSNADIRLFHFSGHAGSGRILMDDGELSHGNILAAMIRYAKHLKLVFLNGCATHDLVDKFLEYGASVVIATKAPVYDRIACDFSNYFYEALCARKLSIGQAFDYAKQKIKDGIKAKLQENFPPQQPTESNEAYDKRIEETGEYNKAIDAFDKAETARSIVKPGKERTGVFQWALYQNEDVSPAQRQANENWKLVDETDLSPIDHIEPSFDFLTSLGQAVIDLKAGLPQTDPHFGIFTEIANQHKQALSWNAAGTNHLIDYLYNLLLSPHASPVRDMINYSKDNRTQLEYPGSSNKTILFNLLTYQVELYKKFIRTAIEIMMSDFMETVIMVSQSGRDDLGKLFNQSLHNNNLAVPLKQLIEGQKNLSDIRFDIDMMRSIVAFLTEGRSKVSNNDRKSFRQFVGEYKGNNYVSGIDVALSNSIHEVAVAIINKFTSGTVEQSSLETLQCYCDRMESALISLFSIHKYLMLYEIITVGKVEAYRRRDRRYRSICHDIFTVSGLLPSTETTTYGENFAENYSVLIVTHRKNFLDYLSLSPFVINVGLFFEQDTLLYFFNGMQGNYMEYTDAEGKGTIHINITSTADAILNIRDTTFLKFSPEIAGASNRELRIQARQRFARVRDQFKKITLLYLILTRDKKTKAAPII